jgi:hypothetical protein
MLERSKRRNDSSYKSSYTSWLLSVLLLIDKCEWVVVAAIWPRGVDVPERHNWSGLGSGEARYTPRMASDFGTDGRGCRLACCAPI